jgi:hypothetical protein
MLWSSIVISWWEFLKGRVDLRARQRQTAFDFFRLQGAQQGAGTLPNPAASPAADGRQHGDVPKQLLGKIQAADGGLGLRLPSLEVEQRFGDDAIADKGRAVPPSGIEKPHFPARELSRRDGARQRLAVVPIGARQGDEVLGRRVRDDPAVADRLLRGIGQLGDEGESPAHPAGGPIESAGQFFEGEPEPASDLLEEPRLLQGGLRASLPKRSCQKEGVGLRKVPARGPDHVLLEAHERADALVAVDHDRRGGSSVGHDDHDGNELSQLGEGGDESLVLLRGEDPESLVPQIELAQFQFHASSCLGSHRT